METLATDLRANRTLLSSQPKTKGLYDKRPCCRRSCGTSIGRSTDPQLPQRFLDSYLECWRTDPLTALRWCGVTSERGEQHQHETGALGPDDPGLIHGYHRQAHSSGQDATVNGRFCRGRHEDKRFQEIPRRGAEASADGGHSNSKSEVVTPRITRSDLLRQSAAAF